MKKTKKKTIDPNQPTRWERRIHRASHAWTPWSNPKERTIRTFLEGDVTKIKYQNRTCKICNLQEESTL